MDYIHRLAAEAHLHECIVLAHELIAPGTGPSDGDEALRTALYNELADLALVTGTGEDPGRSGDLMWLYGTFVNIRFSLERTMIDQALVGFDDAERDRQFDECLKLAGETAAVYLGPTAGPLMRRRAAKFRDITVTAPERTARQIDFTPDDPATTL